MKVALTIWERRVSPVFDVCREALILEIGEGNVLSTARESLDSATPLQKIERLMSLDIETLICGAISEPMYWELTRRGVKVIGFIAGDVGEVVQAFVSEALPNAALSMPGCCGRQTRFRGGRGRKRGRNRQRGGINNRDN